VIGNFYRDGKLYTTEAVRVNDHDFESLSEGKAAPHGLYDVFNNIGYITLSMSSGTSEFAAGVFVIGG
jgi:hypothetical protein